MFSPFKDNLYQSIAIVLLAVLAANLIVGNVLEQPKIGQAFFADIAHFLLRGFVFIWEIGKDAAAAAFRQMAQKELNWENAKQWAWEGVKNATAKALKTAQKHIMDQMVDRLTDYIEGRETPSGKSQYVKDWKGVFLDALAMGAYEFSQELAGIDLCSPLGFETKAEAKALLEIPIPKFSQQMVCTREEIVANVKGFYANFEGGWDTWLKVTHPNQNFYGSYLMALDAKVDAMARAQEAEALKVEAGSGWRGLEECVKWFNKELNLTLERTANMKGDVIDPKTKKSAIDIILRQPIQPADDTLEACGLTAEGDVDIIMGSNPAQQCKQDCLATNVDCAEVPSCNNLSADCLLNSLGFNCTANRTQTPGDLVGRSVAQALGYESEWFLDSEDFGQYSAAIVNSGIVRAARFGLDKFNKVTSWASSLFSSKEEEQAARVDASAFCQDEPDIISRRACQMCPGLTKGSKAYKACMEYSKARVAEDLLVSGAFGENMDWANLQGLALLEQAIKTKEAVSRALQKMGGAAYYGRTKNPQGTLRFLMMCRWQACVSHEVRNLLIKYCGLEKSAGVFMKYSSQDNLAMAYRNNGVVQFRDAACLYPPGSIAQKEQKCGNILKSEYSGKNLQERCQDDCGDNTTCMASCLQRPHNGDSGMPDAYNNHLCLDLAKKQVLGPYDASISASYNVGQPENYPYIIFKTPQNQINSYETFTDPQWQKECFLAPYPAANSNVNLPDPAPYTCDLGWLDPIICFDDMNWRQAGVEYSQFNQKSPRFIGNELIPGWWDYESKIKIDDKILYLEKEIGQDSSYQRLHPNDSDVGLINMAYEYGDKCNTKCDQERQICQEDCKNKTYYTTEAECKNDCQTQESTCYQDCTHIDVFSELTVEDIDAMFTPFGLADAQAECSSKKDQIQEYEKCFNDFLATKCNSHCQKICEGNATCIQDCKNRCDNRLSLGINCTPNQDRSGLLHCSSEERDQKLGSLRVLQWEILDFNRLVEAYKEIKEFVEQEMKPFYLPISSRNDPEYDKFKQYLFDIARKEQEMLSPAAKYYSGNPLITEEGDRVLWYAMLKVGYRDKESTCALGLGADKEQPPNVSSCPLTELWNIARYDLENSRDNALAIFLKKSISGTIEDSIKRYEEQLNNKTNQIPSQTELQELQQELESINDLMDPENTKNKNRDIIKKLDDEDCKTYLGRDEDELWPGEDKLE